MLSSGNVMTLMHEGRKVRTVVLLGSLMDYQSVGLEYGFEPFTSVAGLVTELDETGKVAGDVTFVPGHQNRFDIGKILVQSRTSDAGLLGDL